MQSPCYQRWVASPLPSHRALVTLGSACLSLQLKVSNLVSLTSVERIPRPERREVGSRTHVESGIKLGLEMRPWPNMVFKATESPRTTQVVAFFKIFL